MSVLALPSNYPRIQRVKSFNELISTPFAGGVNALCWERTLPGDFHEIVTLLGGCEAIQILDEELLSDLPVSAAGRIALETLLADQRLLRERDLAPVLNCIRGYPRDNALGPLAADVFSFHVDSAPVEADTYLCTYYGPPSEGLRQEDARRKIDIPEIRAALLKQFGGEDDAAFRNYLSENCYDLHYAAATTAQPFSFGIGHLWRIATEWPDSPVPPCVHRAPETVPGQSRLLLIS